MLIRGRDNRCSKVMNIVKESMLCRSLIQEDFKGSWLIFYLVLVNNGKLQSTSVDSSIYPRNSYQIIIGILFKLICSNTLIPGFCNHQPSDFYSVGVRDDVAMKRCSLLDISLYILLKFSKILF